jgi:hypothetical protein
MNLLFLKRIDFFPIEIRGMSFANTEYYMHWILLSEFLGFLKLQKISLNFKMFLI